MKICESHLTIRAMLEPYYIARTPLAFIPTMGNLHAGHLSLIQTARQYARCVVVSLFVNPLQFAPHEDFASYPRTLKEDLDKLSSQGVDVVMIPKREELFSRDENTFIQMNLPHLTQHLCGITRPRFFQGVMVIVAKLFNIVQPQYAIFGEKDYQQLLIIKQMVTDLNFPITVIASPIVREKDGLAMSSRNQYLLPEERVKAVLLYQQLDQLKNKIKEGNINFAELEIQAKHQLNDNHFKTDYIAVRKKSDLSLPDNFSQDLIILGAAYLGKTRLIDNVFVEF